MNMAGGGLVNSASYKLELVHCQEQHWCRCDGSNCPWPWTTIWCIKIILESMELGKRIWILKWRRNTKKERVIHQLYLCNWRTKPTVARLTENLFHFHVLHFYGHKMTYSHTPPQECQARFRSVGRKWASLSCRKRQLKSILVLFDLAPYIYFWSGKLKKIGRFLLTFTRMGKIKEKEKIPCSMYS